MKERSCEHVWGRWYKTDSGTSGYLKYRRCSVCGDGESDWSPHPFLGIGYCDEDPGGTSQTNPYGLWAGYLERSEVKMKGNDGIHN